jgi:hypothetical protein
MCIQDVNIGRGTYVVSTTIPAGNPVPFKANPQRLAVVIVNINATAITYIGRAIVGAALTQIFGSVTGPNAASGYIDTMARIFHVSMYGSLVTNDFYVQAAGNEGVCHEILADGVTGAILQREYEKWKRG